MLFPDLPVLCRPRYVVDPSVGVPRAARDLCTRLCELGWLFRRVRADVASPTGGADRGAVGRAFSAAVHAELNDYFRLIAVLESQSHLPPPEGAPAGGSGGGGGGSDDGTYLTLRRLDLWLAEPLQRMRLLAVLVDCTRGLKGASAPLASL